MKKIISLLVVCLLATVAYAEKPLQFIFMENVSNDDNIYLTKDNKKSSVISSSQLFLKYLNAIPNSGLNFGAKVNLGYNAYTENSSKNNYMNAGADLKLSNKKFILNEKFLYTADPATSELTDRAKRINNNASFKYRSSLEKLLSVGFVVSDSYDKYEDKDFDYLNRNRFNVGAQLYYNMSSKTSFYLGYLFSKIDYEKREKTDSLENSVSLGVNGNVTSKIKGTAQVSYDMRNYDKEIEGIDSNAGIVGYLLSLTYEPTKRNSISLKGERKMEEAIFVNNRYYVSTEVGAEYKQTLCDHWNFSIFASYENLAYPEKVDNDRRADDLVNVKPSIEYKFKEYLFASVWYKLQNKYSNFDYVEYVDNKVGVQVKLVF